MKAAVRKSKPSETVGPDEGSTLYREFLKTRPSFSSSEDARREYMRELRALADAGAMSVQEMIHAAENSPRRTDEQRRIMKLASWISALA